MTWSLVYSHNAKFITHIVHDSIVFKTTEDLFDRLGEKSDLKPVDRYMFDLPGMMWMERGYQEIVLDSLRIIIPYSDFGSLYDMWNEDMPLRKFDDGTEYYKLHTGYHTCLVCTVAQRDLLLEEMKRLVPSCMIQAENEVTEQIRRLKSTKVTASK